MKPELFANQQSDPYLVKELCKLMHRIERILVPAESTVYNPVVERLAKVQSKLQGGNFFQTVTEIDGIAVEKALVEKGAIRRVNWAVFEKELELAIFPDNPGSLPPLVKEEFDVEMNIHETKLEAIFKKERLRSIQNRNNQPVMPGRWRKEAYAPRVYDPLTEYVVTSSVSEEEGKQLKDQLYTTLDGFLGQAYNYDDHGLTEEWMVSFQDKSTSGPSEDDVIQTQIESLLEIMKVQVQDRVCNEGGVLRRAPVGLGKDLKEVPVWGIDCYTRRNVEIAIEDRCSSATSKTLVNIQRFIEKKLLPAINAQEVDKAHNMTCALNHILESATNTEDEKAYTQAVLAAIAEQGLDQFKIHPKGTGVVCINPHGIPPHVFISEYLGEMYPPYRWCEKLDVVEQAQRKFELKPTLPDFYNILLERPRQDPRGYGLLYVDASQRANMGSSCSHSCDSNCTSAVVARNGKLVIALTTNRHVAYGEELTMDYYSITTSETEWRAAICLCGHATCRGSFLHYATQDDLQQVLDQNCGPLWRYASLLRACTPLPLKQEDTDILLRHGMGVIAMGSAPPLWMSKYAADNLRFVEYERKALPCALLRSKNGHKSNYVGAFTEADLDARSVMEQRIQSMVCCFSMIDTVLAQLNNTTMAGKNPLEMYSSLHALDKVWNKMLVIPGLLEEFVLNPLLVGTVNGSVANGSASKGGRKRGPKPKGTTSAATGPAPAPAPVTTAFTAPESTPPAVEFALPSVEESIKSDSAVATSEPTLPPAPTGPSAAEQAARAIDAATDLLKRKPSTMLELREICKQLRSVMQGIEHLSNSKARLGQLADVLALWANTFNYSFLQEFDEVESQPITVVARELGTNIPRKILQSKEPSAASSTRRGKAAAAKRPSKVPRDASSSPNYWKTESGSDTHSVTASAAGAMAVVADAMPSTPQDEEILNTDSASADEEGEGEGFAAVATDERAAAEEDVLMEVERALGMPVCMDEQDLEACKANNANYTLFPNETVFEGRKKYPKEFIFWQLMGWYNAGTDQHAEVTDLFGCVRLPEPIHCFGTSDLPYENTQRKQLINLLKSDKLQTLPWPKALKDSFRLNNELKYSSYLNSNAYIDDDTDISLFGSPMLDSALGKVEAISNVLSLLLGESYAEIVKKERLEKKKKLYSQKSAAKHKKSLYSQHGGNMLRGTVTEEESQFDTLLPPEMPTSWVQCESCSKWRRVGWYIDPQTLSENWICSMNSWDNDVAHCAAPQDLYDADRESTLEYNQLDPSKEKHDPTHLVINSWRDVYCNRNLIFYEAQIKKMRMSKKRPGVQQILFHFKGWSPKFDEWIDADSDRITGHNAHTDPTLTNPRDQEKWQGVYDITAVIRTAFQNKGSGRKRKSGDEFGDDVENMGGSGGNSHNNNAARTTSGHGAAVAAGGGDMTTGSGKKRGRKPKFDPPVALVEVQNHKKV